MAQKSQSDEIFDQAEEAKKVRKNVSATPKVDAAQEEIQKKTASGKGFDSGLGTYEQIALKRETAKDRDAAPNIVEKRKAEQLAQARKAARGK